MKARGTDQWQDNLYNIKSKKQLLSYIYTIHY